MKDAIVSIVGWMADVTRAVGWKNCALAVICIALIGGGLYLVDRTLGILLKIQTGWSKLSPPYRNAVLILAGLFTLFTATSATSLFKVGLVLAVAGWCTYGAMAMVYARRYDLMDGTPRQAWSCHLQVKHTQRAANKALEASTGKKHGRARTPRVDGRGAVTVMEPPDGVSAEDLAKMVNNGEMHSSLARERGWGQTGAVSAESQPDGTVRVRIDNEPAVEVVEVDHLAEEVTANPETWK